MSPPQLHPHSSFPPEAGRNWKILAIPFLQGIKWRRAKHLFAKPECTVSKIIETVLVMFFECAQEWVRECKNRAYLGVRSLHTA